MTDIKLSDVQVIWNAPENPELPKVALVEIPGDDDDRYYSSWGACSLEFKEANPDQQIGMLLAKFIALAVHDGIDPQEMHDVFSQIPEYRRALADVGGFDPNKV